MASSKEFKQAIREGRLNDAFVIAMSNAPQLHITTWVASGESESKPLEEECLRTHVNLVEGEIINEIGEELISDNLSATLQQFHLQQVTQGHQTISQNLQSLQQMFRLLAVLQKQQKGEAYTPINTWKIADTTLPPASTTNLRLENNSTNQTANFTSASESIDIPSSINEEEDIVDDLLSLDDIDIEVNRQENIPSVESEAKPAAKAEDWGDWLDEDSSEINPEIVDIEDLDLDRSEDWQDEDWGDETEFMPKDER